MEEIERRRRRKRKKHQQKTTNKCGGERERERMGLIGWRGELVNSKGTTWPERERERKAWMECVRRLR